MNISGEIINIDLNKFDNVEFSKLFDDVEIIIPELTENSTIKDITKVFLLDSLLCIYDRSYLGRVFIFDSTGRFVRRIGEMGEGPNEYSDIADVRIHRNSIWMLSAIKNRFLVYNLDGDLVDIVKLPKYERSYKSFSFLNNDSIVFWSGDDLKIKFYSLSRNQIFNEGYEEKYRDIFCSYEFQIDGHLCRGLTNTVYTLKEGNISSLYSWNFGDMNNNLSKIKYPDYNDGESVRKFAEEVYASRVVNYALPYHGMNSMYYYTQVCRKNKIFHLFYNRLNGDNIYFEKMDGELELYPICWTDDYLVGLSPNSFTDMIPNAIAINRIDIKEDSNPALIKYKFKKYGN